MKKMVVFQKIKGARSVFNHKHYILRRHSIETLILDHLVYYTHISKLHRFYAYLSISVIDKHRQIGF